MIKIIVKMTSQRECKMFTYISSFYSSHCKQRFTQHSHLNSIFLYFILHTQRNEYHAMVLLHSVIIFVFCKNNRYSEEELNNYYHILEHTHTHTHTVKNNLTSFMNSRRHQHVCKHMCIYRKILSKH